MNDLISRLAAIDAKKGSWVEIEKDPSTGKYDTSLRIYCSECRYRSDNNPTRFCTSCGADMREKGENSESN